MRASGLSSNLGVLAIISSDFLSDPFSFFLASGDTYSVYIGMFSDIPQVSWTLSMFFILFSLCSSGWIISYLLVLSSAYSDLLLKLSSRFFVSVIALLNCRILGFFCNFCVFVNIFHLMRHHPPSTPPPMVSLAI